MAETAERYHLLDMDRNEITRIGDEEARRHHRRKIAELRVGGAGLKFCAIASSVTVVPAVLSFGRQ